MPSRITIRWCDGAYDSLESASDHFGSKKKRTKWLNKLNTLLDRHRNGERLSNEHRKSEGEIEGSQGKNFWAFRVEKLRVYHWDSRRYTSVCYISHAVYKNWQELKDADIKRESGNYREIEINVSTWDQSR